MFSTFGLLEPNNDLQIAYFGCVIARYFVSFFYDHPVEDAGWISPPHSNIIQEPPFLLGLKQHKIMILTKGKSFWQTWTVKCILVATISCLIRDASDRFSILKWKVSSRVSTNTIQIIDGKGKHEGMKMSAVEFKAKS